MLYLPSHWKVNFDQSWYKEGDYFGYRVVVSVVVVVVIVVVVVEVE